MNKILVINTVNPVPVAILSLIEDELYDLQHCTSIKDATSFLKTALVDLIIIASKEEFDYQFIKESFIDTYNLPIITMGRFQEKDIILNHTFVENIVTVNLDDNIKVLEKVDYLLVKYDSNTVKFNRDIIMLNVEKKAVYLGESKADLSKSEFLLFCVFAKYPNKAFSLSELEQVAFAGKKQRRLLTMRTYAYKLRAKLRSKFGKEEFILETVDGRLMFIDRD